MADIEHPQLYLITPPEFELSSFPGILSACLDAADVSCVRLALSTLDEDRISRAADVCREVCHTRDVALVLSTHVTLAERLGLDGVHLADGSRSVRAVRKTLGSDAIVGCHCSQSRHDGMSAAESGADYVSFGPAAATALGDGSFAELELFEWWSQVIEVPVVAEGALNDDLIRKLAAHVDFFGLGDEIWSEDEPANALKRVCEVIYSAA